MGSVKKKAAETMIMHGSDILFSVFDNFRRCHPRQWWVRLCLGIVSVVIIYFIKKEYASAMMTIRLVRVVTHLHSARPNVR